MKKLIGIIVLLALLVGTFYVFKTLLPRFQDEMFKKAEQSLKEEDEELSEYDKLESLLELRDYVIEKREEEKTEFSVRYESDEYFDPMVVANAYGATFVEVSTQGDLYTIKVAEFPGNRIVRAYKNGDISSLSADEREVLNIATDIVEDALAASDDKWELELLLYEEVCKRVSYYTEETWESTLESQPRFLNVLGAFLDGKANCQGYTDAFYTLAGIAGLKVGRLSVDTEDLSHMVNTICLDGKWYVVDATFGDSQDFPVNYRLFNAGRDLIGEFWWEEEMESYPIAQETDSTQYYYYRNDLCYDDIEDMAHDVVYEWDAHGKTLQNVMLKNDPDKSDFLDALKDRLSDLNLSYSLVVNSAYNEKNCSFYTVVFK